MRTVRRMAWFPALSLAITASVISSVASASSPPPVTPKDRVMVVTANLQEAFNTQDLRNMSEMKVFVKRVLRVLNHRPDVLLLQEVNSKSAHRVAHILSAQTGQHYKVITDAGVKAFREKPKKIIKADTAIVIDTATMANTGRSGYIVTRNKAPGTKVEYKRNARALVRERAGKTRYALASIHIPDHKLARRAKRLAKRLQQIYHSSSPDQTEVLGGDFNKVGGHYLSYGHVATAHFWDVLTKTFHYVDSGYNVSQSRSSDYVFVRRGVWDAGYDRNYNPSAAAGTPSFYSDHQFRWALLGPDSQVPSTPSQLAGSSRRSGSARTKLTWASSHDNAGIATYNILRSSDGNTFHKIGSTPNSAYYDSSVVRGQRYWYRVVAHDFSNNASAPSPDISIQA